MLTGSAFLIKLPFFQEERYVFYGRLPLSVFFFPGLRSDAVKGEPPRVLDLLLRGLLLAALECVPNKEQFKENETASFRENPKLSHWKCLLT